jgi:hypothetical protein
MILPKKNLPNLDSLVTTDSVKTERKRPIKKKTKKKTKDNLDEETKKLRNTHKWKFIYEKELQSFGMLRGGTKDKEERFLKYIDKLATLPPVNQHNIMDSYAPFISLSKKDKLEGEDKN